MANRMDTRRELLNAEEEYQEVFDERGVKHIIQFDSPHLNYPTPKEIAKMNLISHVWVRGDRFYKLAHKHYGESRYWWVIAWFNQTPTESHVSLGQVIRVPTPLDYVLRKLRG